MVDKDKVILMTKLAVYDKNEAESDKRITSYFRNDYILKSNLWTRLSVLLGVLIILISMETYKVFTGELNILAIDYKTQLYDIGFKLVVVLLVYTVISTIVAAIRYNKAEKRLARYFSITAKIKQQVKEDDGEEDGADIVYTRSGR